MLMLWQRHHPAAGKWMEHRPNTRFGDAVVPFEQHMWALVMVARVVWG